jgi:hypothetical protein
MFFFSCFIFTSTPAAHQLHRAGFICLWGGGPCFPFLVFISTSSPLRPQPIHQLHRAGFIRLWHPRMHLFPSVFYFSSPPPPVVVAFGPPALLWDFPTGASLWPMAQLAISV